MSDVRSDVTVMLAAQGMPDEEVLLILSSRDPRTVRRHLELHRERVIERQAGERNAVDVVERVLMSRIDRGVRLGVGQPTIGPWPRARRRSGDRSPMPSWRPQVSPVGPGSGDPQAFGSIARSTRCS